MFGRWKRNDSQNNRPKEERIKEEWKEAGDEGESSVFLLVALVVMISVVFLVVMGIIVSIQLGQTEKEETLSQPGTERNALAEVGYKETSETENGNRDIGYEQDWIGQIFGNTNPVSVTGTITIAGLSEREKSELNFIESDFVKDVGAFLNKQGIMTSLVYFEEKTECSADQARSFVASMSGISDQNLQVIFYPEIPGEYLFLLTGKQKLVIASDEGEGSQQNSPNQNREQVVQSTPQTPQIRNSQTQGTQERQNGIQENKNEENSYNAAALTIYSVSEELQNYIGNQYLLQYALYEHLYQKGYYNVKSATVVSYSIDGDSRSASMLFVLDNGKSVNAVYTLDNRSYEFS